METSPTGHRVVVLCRFDPGVMRTHLVVVDSPDDGARDFLYVSTAHVELDPLCGQSLVAGASDDN